MYSTTEVTDVQLFDIEYVKGMDIIDNQIDELYYSGEIIKISPLSQSSSYSDSYAYETNKSSFSLSIAIQNTLENRFLLDTLHNKRFLVAYKLNDYRVFGTKLGATIDYTSEELITLNFIASNSDNQIYKTTKEVLDINNFIYNPILTPIDNNYSQYGNAVIYNILAYTNKGGLYLNRENKLLTDEKIVCQMYEYYSNSDFDVISYYNYNPDYTFINRDLVTYNIDNNPIYKEDSIEYIDDIQITKLFDTNLVSNKPYKYNITTQESRNFAVARIITTQEDELVSFTGSETYYINWGDGNYSNKNSHIYKLPGEYLIAIYGEIINLSYFNNLIEIIAIKSDQITFENCFRECRNLQYVDIQNIGNLTKDYNSYDVRRMFYRCSSLEYIYNFENVLISGIASFDGLCINCNSLKELILPLCAANNINYLITNGYNIEKLDFSRADFSLLTSSTSSAFTNVPRCQAYVQSFTDGTKLSELGLPEFYVKSRTNGNIIGKLNIPSDNYTVSYTGDENFPTINWGDGVTDNLKSHTYSTAGDYYIQAISNSTLVFREFDRLTELYFVNLISNCNYIFTDCTDLTYIYEITGTPVYMARMFNNCTNLRFVKNWNANMNNIITIHNLFNNCIKLNYIKFPTNMNIISQTADYSGLYSGCINLQYINMSGFPIDESSLYTDIFKNCNSVVSSYAKDEYACQFYNNLDGIPSNITFIPYV